MSKKLEVDLGFLGCAIELFGLLFLLWMLQNIDGIWNKFNTLIK